METRIDWVVKKGGVIKSGVTFSMLVQDKQMYLIKLGPGNTEVFKNGLNAASQMEVDNTRKRLNSKIAPNAKRLLEIGPQAMSEEKGSFRFDLSEIKEFQYAKNKDGYFQLDINANNKKMTLFVDSKYESALGQVANFVK